VIDWLKRAAAFFQERGGTPTDKTDESPLSSVSSVDLPPLSAERGDLSSVSSVGVPPLSAEIADPEKAALDWLHDYLRRDVVPATDVMEHGIRAGHKRTTLFTVARERLLELRGVDGRLYWSRPYSPADINATFARWRERTDNEGTRL
jgi:hypothetical protein